MDFSPFKPPFCYEPMGKCIFDADGHRVLDVRGWGYLTGGGIGGLNMDNVEASETQDRIGSQIAAAMNKATETA